MVSSEKDVTNQDSAPNKSWPQWLATISACLGMFSAGMCFSWSSPTLVLLQAPDSPIKITSNEASWIASLMQFGSAFSPFVALFVSKYMGPKICILMSAIPYTIGFLLIILAENVPELYLARFMCGIGVGFSFLATPIYIVEISENHNRGALMIIFTLSMTMSSLFVSALGPYLSIQAMGEIMIAFPLLLLATFPFAPDTPYYYLRIQNEQKSYNSLRQLRKQPNTKILRQEFELMKEHTQNNLNIVDCCKEFVKSPNLKALCIVLAAIGCQQCCGALTALIYLENLYQDSEVPIATNLAVLMTLVGSNVTIFIAMRFTDAWGRKPLLILSAVGCMVTNILMGVFYEVKEVRDDIPYFYLLPVTALVFLQISFNFGLNPIPYTIAGEVFSSNAKEIALCAVSIGGALIGFIISKLYQIVNDNFGGGTVFFSLTALTFLFLVNIIIFVPETKGRSFPEIQYLLKGKFDSVNDNESGANCNLSKPKDLEKTRF